ncbi:hypothetical protein [Pseudoalteromonas sp. Of7M-16]|uniref:hypothetical protein n=1 Tax=Pseudoalteromonas sp. Of7M-16 TaxID=2917756 RepID=UPI001EF63926|nr:hypothetical protein [Pseudoalteromonas sp. Of7M-16]MCG7550916.1 hypothetical protein [Pseudoalteromonas sp. Of7M-16]
MKDVSGTIDLAKHGRTKHNNRPYLIKAVQKIIASDTVQEEIQLGEMFGYFGHGIRAMTGKMKPSEVEFINVNGKMVKVDVEPSNYCLDVSCSDEGIITHKQRILDTSSGKQVQAMHDGKTGGWSWATSGKPHAINVLAGFDYVKQPSYIDVDKQAMFESIQDFTSFESADEYQMMLESLHAQNQQQITLTDITLEKLMLEEMVKDSDALNNARKDYMLECVNSLPVIMTEAQKNSLVNMTTQHDKEVVIQMFESIAADQRTLPSKTQISDALSGAPSANKQQNESMEFELVGAPRNGNNLYG